MDLTSHIDTLKKIVITDITKRNDLIQKLNDLQQSSQQQFKYEPVKPHQFVTPEPVKPHQFVTPKPVKPQSQVIEFGKPEFIKKCCEISAKIETFKLYLDFDVIDEDIRYMKILNSEYNLELYNGEDINELTSRDKLYETEFYKNISKCCHPNEPHIDEYFVRNFDKLHNTFIDVLFNICKNILKIKYKYQTIKNMVERLKKVFIDKGRIYYYGQISDDSLEKVYEFIKEINTKLNNIFEANVQLIDEQTKKQIKEYKIDSLDISSDNNGNAELKKLFKNYKKVI
jgi:hypothetical protein